MWCTCTCTICTNMYICEHVHVLYEMNMYMYNIWCTSQYMYNMWYAMWTCTICDEHVHVKYVMYMYMYNMWYAMWTCTCTIWDEHCTCICTIWDVHVQYVIWIYNTLCMWL